MVDCHGGIIQHPEGDFLVSWGLWWRRSWWKKHCAKLSSRLKFFPFWLHFPNYRGKIKTLRNKFSRSTSSTHFFHPSYWTNYSKISCLEGPSFLLIHQIPGKSFGIWTRRNSGKTLSSVFKVLKIFRICLREFQYRKKLLRAGIQSMKIFRNLAPIQWDSSWRRWNL